MASPSVLALLVLLATLFSLAGCGGGGADANGGLAAGPALINGRFQIAYVKRPVAAISAPTDGITFQPGGDLYVRDLASASAGERNITARYTGGAGDVSDPEVSFDGARLLFAMKGPDDATWNIWEYTFANDTLRRLIDDGEVAHQGDDADPAYLPDGRIVFSSNRQAGSRAALARNNTEPYIHTDEYERGAALVLHVMNSDGSGIEQISFNQSHDRNPTVLSTGEIMYSRWDHVGPRNQFSIFFTNPDGTNTFVLYGAHSPGNSFLHPREMEDGRVMSSLMPLSGTREGGAVVIIDIKNYSENDAPAPGVAPGGQGQRLATVQEIPLDTGLSRFGRYTSPAPLWDGTERALVSWTPSQPTPATDPVTGAEITVEGDPVYGLYVLDMAAQTLRLLVPAPPGFAVTDGIAIMPRPKPNIIESKPLDAELAAQNLGILNVKSVYDTDALERMGEAVLAPGETIPRIAAGAGDTRTQVADLQRLKDPQLTSAAQRPARFVRVTRAVPVPAGLSRQTIGETDFEPQQLLGYAEIEPDGSFKVKVPADTPLALTVVDAEGRGFTPHTSWLQVRPGETRTCNGCHSPRRASALNVEPIAGNHPPLFGVNAPGALHVHPGTTVTSVLRAEDPEGDPLTYRIVDLPTQGTAFIIDEISGAFTYTARQDATVGKDFFTFVANDGSSDSNVGTITINIHPPPSANQGESMAETRVRYYPEVATLNPDLIYQDVWGPRANPCLSLRYTGNASCAGEPLLQEDLTTPAPQNGVINFEEHIQPLLSKDRGEGTCTSCHNSADAASRPSAGLDLRDTLSGSGRKVSYESLLVGQPELDDNGAPVFDEVDGVPHVRRAPAHVIPGSARSSYLMEKLAGRELRAAKPLSGTVDHSAWFNRAEKRLLAEWIDLGAQYFNDPFGADANGNGLRELTELRNSVTGLDESVFATTLHPILMKRCGACHGAQAAAGTEGGASHGSRFVLTGQVDGDYNVTASMVNDLRNPANSYLLQRPASNGVTPNPVHPQIANGAGNPVPVLAPEQPADGTVAADYAAMLHWIEVAQAANGL